MTIETTANECVLKMKKTSVWSEALAWSRRIEQVRGKTSTYYKKSTEYSELECRLTAPRNKHIGSGLKPSLNAFRRHRLERPVVYYRVEHPTLGLANQ
jgi:hypothetical protein